MGIRKAERAGYYQNKFLHKSFTRIQNTFALILGPLEKLLDGKTKGDPASQYQLMHNHASRLLQLVNQLLDLSSLDAGKMKLEIGVYDIVSFVKSIVSSFQHFAEEKKISINFSSKSEKLDACFDRDKLQKIISNLLSNAIKFNKENGSVNILLSEKRGKGISYLQIEVEDNGSRNGQRVSEKYFRSLL